MAENAQWKDPLTGAFTRASFDSRMQFALEQAQEAGVPLALLIIDPDHFKSINDAFGHARGDEVLADIAQRMAAMIRGSDTLFRYGGDKFVLLLPETSVTQAQTLAERLLSRMRGSPFPGDPPLSLSLSIGIADSDEAPSAETLFAKADERLLSAKRLGRGMAVAQDVPEPARLALEEISHLIERETQLQKGHDYLDLLLEEGQGIFAIFGHHGSGRTCFLEEICKTAKLRGYSTLRIEPSAALKVRPFGALLEALTAWGEAPFDAGRLSEFKLILPRLLQAQGKLGLLISVDNLEFLDPQSLKFLRNLVNNGANTRLGLAFTAENAARRAADSLELSRKTQVEIGPFSLNGVRIWLRDALQWEPGEAFLEWIYTETAGFPKHLSLSMQALMDQGLIRRLRTGSWRLDEDYNRLALGAWLAEQSDTPANNLPPLTPFVGRHDELRLLKSTLQTEHVVSLLGPGGIGKSRLALQAAAESLMQFEDGVYFISLAPLESADMLPLTVADALGLELSGKEAPEDQVVDHLKTMQMLLIMDNFEHLPTAVDFVISVLEKAPGVTLLITSRDRLKLPQGAQFELEDLATPEEETTENIYTFASMQLFIISARRELSQFVLRPEDRPFTIRICQLLEGMPLGIELVAAWVDMFSLQEIVEQIEADLDFLATSRPDVPKRRRVLRAVFDRFWSFLSESEQLTLRKLSVFRGGFTRQAAENVAGASFFFLSALLDRSFLRIDQDGRYEMHEVLRQYAEEDLQEMPDVYLKARDLHSQYFARLLEREEPHLRGGQQTLASETLSREIDNIRRSWRWAVEQLDTGVMTIAAEALHQFYEMRNFYAEAQETFGSAVSRLKASKEEISAPLLGQLLASQGRFACHTSQYPEARTLLEESIALLEPSNKPHALANARTFLGDVLRESGEYAAAAKEYEDSLLIQRQNQDLYGIANALNNLAVTAIRQGEFERGRERIEESISILREIEDLRGVAKALNNLGAVERNLGHAGQALPHLEESLTLWRQLGDQSGQGRALNNLGRAAFERGDWDTCYDLCRESLVIHRQLNDHWGSALASANMGAAALGKGAITEATRRYYDALDLSISMQATPMVLESLVGIGGVRIAQGRFDEGVLILDVVLQHPAANQESKSGAQMHLARAGEEIGQAGMDDLRNRQAEGRTLAQVLALVQDENPTLIDAEGPILDL